MWPVTHRRLDPQDEPTSLVASTEAAHEMRPPSRSRAPFSAVPWEGGKDHSWGRRTKVQLLKRVHLCSYHHCLCSWVQAVEPVVKLKHEALTGSDLGQLLDRKRGHRADQNAQRAGIPLSGEGGLLKQLTRCCWKRRCWARWTPWGCEKHGPSASGAAGAFQHRADRWHLSDHPARDPAPGGCGHRPAVRQHPTRGTSQNARHSQTWRAGPVIGKVRAAQPG